MRLPPFLMTILKGATLSRREYEKTECIEKKTTYDAMRDAVSLEFRERRKHFKCFDIYSEEPSEHLQSFIRDLISESVQYRNCFRMTEDDYYLQKYNGCKKATRRLIEALEKNRNY